MPEPNAYDIILGQLARIEGKLDRLPDTFVARQEYEKRHEELLRAVSRIEADSENDIRELLSTQITPIVERVQTMERNFTRALWVVAITAITTGLGIITFLVQGHIVF